MREFLRRIDQEFTEDRARVMAAVGVLPFIMIMGWALIRMVVWEWDNGYTFGFDFTAFWAAAKLAVAGNAHWAFDIDLFDPLADLAGRVGGYLYWHYPPTWVALLYPFGWMAPPTALLVFSAITLSVWTWIVVATIPVGTWGERLAVLLSPALYLTIIGGQNGVLVAACLCLFVHGVFQKRDWMVVLACTLLLAKPHFGVLMPVVLIALGRWKAVGASAVFGTVFIVASIALTGRPYLDAFIANFHTLSTAIDSVGLVRLQYSLYAFLKSLGVSQSIAVAAQVPVALAAIGTCWIAFRSEHYGRDLQTATFLIGSLMISPYAFIYDLPAAVIGMWFLHRAIKHTPIPGYTLVFSLVWLTPAVHQKLFNMSGVSLGFIPMAAVSYVVIASLMKKNAPTGQDVALDAKHT
ncbi:MAG: glycosyltransferase family 87 protein [Pseudomonadota bacterium]